MYGIMTLGAPQADPDYTLEDIEFLTLLGEITATCIEHILSKIDSRCQMEEFRDRNALYERICSCARKASEIRNLDDAYDVLGAHLRNDFGVESYGLALFSPAHQEYRLFAGNRISPESINRFRLTESAELIGLVSNLSRIHEVADFRENSEITQCYTNDDLGLMQQYWIVPLANLNWLTGFITINKLQSPWSDFQRELILSSADMLAPVFANCILLEDRQDAFKDPFSPLEKHLQAELHKVKELQTEVTLLEIRVKNMKRLHALNADSLMNDYVNQLEQCLTASLLKNDFMARLGQGRFVLVLSGKGPVEAEKFHSELKTRLQHLKISESPVQAQYTGQMISAPADTEDPGKMLAILD